MISTNSGLYSSYQNTSPNPASALPPSSTTFARRTSASAESIPVDGETIGPLPVISKTADQLRRIRNSITGDSIFCDLDEEQETGVLNAMQEMKVDTSEVVIRQGISASTSSGHLNCYIVRSHCCHLGCSASSARHPSSRKGSFSNQTITQSLASDIFCMPLGQKRGPTCWPCG